MGFKDDIAIPFLMTHFTGFYCSHQPAMEFALHIVHVVQILCKLVSRAKR